MGGKGARIIGPLGPLLIYLFRVQNDPTFLKSWISTDLTVRFKQSHGPLVFASCAWPWHFNLRCSGKSCNSYKIWRSSNFRNDLRCNKDFYLITICNQFSNSFDIETHKVCHTDKNWLNVLSAFHKLPKIGGAHPFGYTHQIRHAWYVFVSACLVAPVCLTA